MNALQEVNFTSPNSMEITLSEVLQELSLLKFEMTLMIGSLVLLVAGLITREEKVFKSVLAGTFIASLFYIGQTNVSVISASGAIEIDAVSNLLRLLFASISIWIIFYTIPDRKSEHYFLILSILIGSSFMLSANHLLLFYLAIELTSISSYLITGLGAQKKTFEAALKYLLFGGVSSAIMLYGISIVYALTGEMRIDQLGGLIINAEPFLHVGVLCILCGLFFKISIIPFHIWVPSTYEQAPTDAVAILSIVPKIAGLFLLHRVLTGFELLSNEGYYHLILGLGIISILLGTFGALRQQLPKRMLAYGAIAHSGLMLATIIIPGESGGLSFLWYSVIYSIMNMAVFHVISIYESNHIISIEDYKGTGKIQPYLGAIALWLLIALTGLPPTAGFSAKFILFTSMWKVFQTSGDLWMVTYTVIGILSVVFALFYYLKIPYASFILSGKQRDGITFSKVSQVLVTIFSIVLLWMFISPELLNKIAFNINLMDW